MDDYDALKVMYIGKFCDDAVFLNLRGIRPPSYVAQQAFERALLCEWLQDSRFMLSIVSLVQSRSFPAEPLFFRRSKSEVPGLKYIEYINLPYAREVCIFVMTLLAIFRWSWKSRRRGCLFLATNFVPTTAAAVISSRILGVPLILTLTDLVSFSYAEERIRRMPWMRRRVARLYRSIAGLLERSADGYVVFSEGMLRRLSLVKSRSLVMEGILDAQSLPSMDVHGPRTRAVAHAGTLDGLYGIRTILDVFSRIEDPELELWLIGSGDMDDEIKLASRADPRIKQFGLVSREELFGLLSKASLLINFRNPDDSYTDLSFPSKLFEYLASATPVLSTVLRGIPSEYWQHLYSADCLDSESLARQVMEILDTPGSVLRVRGERGRDFVLREKSPAAQGRRVCEFVLQCAHDSP